jgi:hypothetical protein
MSAIVPTFSAYPSSPTQVGEVVEHAVRNLKEKSGIEVVQSWRQLDIAGRFIADQVLNRIRSSRRMLRNLISMKRMKLDTRSFPTK